ncbi:hypothetical protein GALMADRAFT_235207 [Galerina marginata CBS 339.88]|uniref:Uncharacterized protein n=1 Tax=Galerina marginata (strain CBS 339.88) TaxID=685588 RepID=A0A067TS82_GALM3|nr:hypothetical protein GALMADRAFT_235207 [Galerina marginata CBS 339.88]
MSPYSSNWILPSSVDGTIQCTCRLCLRTHCTLQPGSTQVQCTSRLCFQCAVLQLKNTSRNINVLLPFEIMARIFWFCLPQYTTADFSHENRTEMMRTAAPLLFGAVCPRWRDIAWRTPSLWTSITIYLFPKKTSFQNEMINEWLGRAGGLPLDLSVYCYEQYATPEYFLILPLSIRLHYAHRLRSLELHLPHRHLAIPPDFFRYLLSDLTAGTHDGHSIIESLLVKTSGDRDRAQLNLLSLPSLRKLDLCGPLDLPKIHVQWQNLARLDLSTRRLDVVETLKILKQASKLVECKISFRSYNPGPGSPIPEIPVMLHNLNRLEIEQHSDNSKPFFHNLVLPGLSFLKITNPVFSELTIDTFASFLVGSQCLRELILEQLSGLDNDVVINILRVAPSVRVLHLASKSRFSSWSWPIYEGFLQALTGPEPLLPHLEVIELEGSCYFSWASVCKLTRVRLQSPSWKHTFYPSNQYHTVQLLRMKVHDPTSDFLYKAMPENMTADLRHALGMGLSVSRTDTNLGTTMEISQGARIS